MIGGRGHSILRRGSHGDKVFTVHMGNNQMLDKVGVIVCLDKFNDDSIRNEEVNGI